MIKRWLRRFLGINDVIEVVLRIERDSENDLDTLHRDVQVLSAQMMDLREKMNLDPMVPSDFDPTEYIGVGGDPQLGA